MIFACSINKPSAFPTTSLLFGCHHIHGNLKQWPMSNERSLYIDQTITITSYHFRATIAGAMEPYLYCTPNK